ncbi:protein of unknown function [Streptomyces murinus]
MQMMTQPQGPSPIDPYGTRQSGHRAKGFFDGVAFSGGTWRNVRRGRALRGAWVLFCRVSKGASVAAASPSSPPPQPSPPPPPPSYR